MTTDPPSLTDDEREALARNPQDPGVYARIRDLPLSTGGARTVNDVLAALDSAKKEDAR